MWGRKKKDEIPPANDDAMRNALLSGGRAPPQGQAGQQQPQGRMQPPSAYGSYNLGPAQPAQDAKSGKKGKKDEIDDSYKAAPSFYSSYDPRSQRNQQSQQQQQPGQGQQQQGFNYGQTALGGGTGNYGQQYRGAAPGGGAQVGADPNYDPNRAALFANAKPLKPQNSEDPYSAGGSYKPGEDDSYREGGEQINDEDEEVEAIKQQMRFTKQESLVSTRNALRAAREAAEVGSNTLVKLGDQSERLANTERAIDMTKAHNDRALDEAKEIKTLNQSIFRPHITFNKAAKRDAAERKIIERHHEERAEREETRRQVFESRERITNTFRQAEHDQRAQQTKVPGLPGSGSKVAGRSRYQFEADEEDDQVEDEINNNLDEISSLSKNLNMLARAAGEEVRSQNTKLDQLNYKADRVDTKIVANGLYLNRNKLLQAVHVGLPLGF